MRDSGNGSGRRGRSGRERRRRKCESYRRKRVSKEGRENRKEKEGTTRAKRREEEGRRRKEQATKEKERKNTAEKTKSKGKKSEETRERKKTLSSYLFLPGAGEASMDVAAATGERFVEGEGECEALWIACWMCERPEPPEPGLAADACHALAFDWKKK